jgi:ferrous iron transport protein B
VINIMDASVLSRSLELTLELLELKIPLVICLNMIDEAARKGVEIDVSTCPRIWEFRSFRPSRRGVRGSRSSFKSAIKTAKTRENRENIFLSLDVEGAVSELAGLLGQETAGRMKLPSEDSGHQVA